MTNLIALRDTFKNKGLLEQALTHRSWVNENPNTRGTNERLEFLGDAILEFVVSKEIYKMFPDKEEGYLTSLRANLVNTKNLASLAIKIGVGEKLFLSKGEEDGGGRNNTSLLADSIEAIIGSIFLDQGLDAVENFIFENILVDAQSKASSSLKDPKSLLQEKIQAKGLPAPKYQVHKEEGPDHNKLFTIEVIIDNKSEAVGTGKSKSEAEQEAAKNALSSYCGININEL